jgi:hypothetical protein
LLVGISTVKYKYDSSFVWAELHMTEAKENQLIEEARKGKKESFEKLKALH